MELHLPRTLGIIIFEGEGERNILEAMTMMNHEASGSTEEMLIYVVCPCKCGRDIAFKGTSSSGDISEMANQAWRRLACEKGIEGAIEYLHKKAEKD